MLFGLTSISGNNIFLQISSLSVMLIAYLIKVNFRYMTVITCVLVLGTILFFVFFIAYSAPSNAMRLFQFTIYAYLIGHTCNQFGKLAVSEKSQILALLLFVFFFFAFLQFTGVLGPRLDHYHVLVGNELPTNLFREATLAFLGYRMHGIFSEPSYFGTFVGLFLYGKYRIDKNRVFLVTAFLTAFVLCPTPNLFLSVVSMFSVAALMHEKFGTLKFLLYALTLVAASVYWFRDHLNAYWDVFMLLEYTNTSLSLRILNPIITFLKFIGSGNVFLDLECVGTQNALCHTSALKFPLISMTIFFSVFYTAFFVVFSAKFFSTKLIPTILILFVSSALSGGGIFSVQFYFIFSLMQVLGNHERLIR